MVTLTDERKSSAESLDSDDDFFSGSAQVVKTLVNMPPPTVFLGT